MAAVAGISRANLADMGDAVPDAVRAMASLGGWGAHPQNQERDLHKWVHKLHNLNLETYDVVMNLQVWFGKNMFEPILNFWSCFCFSGFLSSFYTLLPPHQSAVQAPNEDGTRPMTIPFLLPHEIFEALGEAEKTQVGMGFQSILNSQNYTIEIYL